MIFETTKYDYIFIIGIWIVTMTLELTICSFSHDITAEQSKSFMTNVSNAVTAIMGSYGAIAVFLLSFDIIRKKFDVRKNYKIFGQRAAALLLAVLGDGISLIMIINGTFVDISPLENKLPLWLYIFPHGGFSIISLFLAWNLRKQKIPTEDSR